LGVGLKTLPCKKKIVEKPPRNSAGFCGGGQGLSWAVEPRKEEDQMKQDKMGRTCSAYGIDENAYKILVRNPERKRPLGRPRRRWKDIKTDLRETG
jgi:hypothetical protein